MNVKRTPSRLCPNGDEDINPEIEAVPQPHVDRDFEERSVFDNEAENTQRDKAMRSQVRITNRDLKLYGYTPGVHAAMSWSMASPRHTRSTPMSVDSECI